MAPRPVRRARRAAKPAASGRIIYCPAPGHKIVVMQAPFDLGKTEIGS
jgi:hypothetical protein